MGQVNLESDLLLYLRPTLLRGFNFGLRTEYLIFNLYHAKSVFFVHYLLNFQKNRRSIDRSTKFYSIKFYLLPTYVM